MRNFTLIVAMLTMFSGAAVFALCGAASDVPGAVVAFGLMMAGAVAAASLEFPS